MVMSGVIQDRSYINLGSYRVCLKFVRLSPLSYTMGGYYSGHFEVLRDPDPQSSECLE
jgi:hypothetical protein